MSENADLKRSYHPKAAGVHPNRPLSHSGKGAMTSISHDPRFTISSVTLATKLSLQHAGIDEAALEAEVLTRHVTGIDRAAFYAHPNRIITGPENQHLATLIARRCQHEPLPYVLGHWEFYGLDFIVNSAVLIPRPETETIVEQALIFAHSGTTKELGTTTTNGAHQLRIIDVGTGSGCIAIALAKHLPQASITATDISTLALVVTSQNIDKHNVQNQVSLVECDLATTNLGKFDLIVSNPPYIPDVEVPSLQQEVSQYEPLIALAGGSDGLSIIRRLLKRVTNLLSPNGAIMIEFNPPQKTALVSAVYSILPDAKCKVIKDLSGLDRLLVIELEKRPRE